MKKEYKIGIAAAIIIIVVLGIVLIPGRLETYRNKYRAEGYNTAINLVVLSVLKDLKEQGHTIITIGNQTIKLGVIR